MYQAASGHHEKKHNNT